MIMLKGKVRVIRTT